MRVGVAHRGEVCPAFSAASVGTDASRIARLVAELPTLGFSKDRPSVVRLSGVHSHKRCRLLRLGTARHRARSALVVSHHLDGFLLQSARRLVASCSRPWGSSGFGPAPCSHPQSPACRSRSRAASPMPRPSELVPTRAAVLHITVSRSPLVVHQRAPLARPRGLSPHERPLHRRRVATTDHARCSLGLPFLKHPCRLSCPLGLPLARPPCGPSTCSRRPLPHPTPRDWFGSGGSDLTSPRAC
jgi:hypothetical protein